MRSEDRFSSDKEAITFVNNYFAEKNAEYYLGGLQRWEHRWEKCVELQGDYVEKKFLKKCLVTLLGRKLFRPLSYMHNTEIFLSKVKNYLLRISLFSVDLHVSRLFESFMINFRRRYISCNFIWYSHQLPPPSHFSHFVRHEMR